MNEPEDVLVSIIIPTFNRNDVIARSIDSALKWTARLGELGSRVETIVVDDASQDATLNTIKCAYAEEIERGALRLVELPVNRGVTGARNMAAQLATGRWLLHLDSDDTMVMSTAEEVRRILNTEQQTPLHFFRCQILGTGDLIGAPLERSAVTVREYISAWRWGECLPVIRRDALLQFPYDESLRGHEGIAYARIMSVIGPAVVHPLIARNYEMTRLDRLSTRQAIWARADLLARGYAITLREFWPQIPWRDALKLAGKITVYRTVATAQRFAAKI